MTIAEFVHFSVLFAALLYVLFLGKAPKKRVMLEWLAVAIYFIIALGFIWNTYQPDFWFAIIHTVFGALFLLFGSTKISYAIAILFCFAYFSIDILSIIEIIPMFSYPVLLAICWYILMIMICGSCHDTPKYIPLSLRMVNPSIVWINRCINMCYRFSKAKEEASK